MRRYQAMRKPAGRSGASRLRKATQGIRQQAYYQARGATYAPPASLYPSRRTGGTELKCVDDIVGGNQNGPFNAAGLVASPLGTAGSTTGYPIEGSGFYNRIGRRIRMKSLQIDGTIQPSNGNVAAVAGQFARVLVVYDRQTNGAAPSVQDILQNYDESGATSAALPVYQHVNMNNRDRFTILRDRKVYLPPIGVNGAAPANAQGVQIDPNEDNSFVFREFIKLKGLEMHFKSSSATGPIADVATGALLVLTVGATDANATAAWQLQYTSRLKFYD